MLYLISLVSLSSGTANHSIDQDSFLIGRLLNAGFNFQLCLNLDAASDWSYRALHVPMCRCKTSVVLDETLKTVLPSWYVLDQIELGFMTDWLILNIKNITKLYPSSFNSVYIDALTYTNLIEIKEFIAYFIIEKCDGSM